jgi:hypothetical protein
MRQYITFTLFILLTACVTTEPTILDTPETRAKKAEQAQLQRDIKHNSCVSNEHIVGSEEYDKCMAEQS